MIHYTELSLSFSRLHPLFIPEGTKKIGLDQPSSF